MDKKFNLTFESSLGPIEIWANENGVTRVVIGRMQDLTSTSTIVEAAEPAIARHLTKAKGWIEHYLESGEEAAPPQLDISGTPFQLAVWQEIRKLSPGQAATYGEIASRIGKPAAVRAVGGAVGANPVPLLIGCHRVLGQGGRITGYSGGDGLATKRILLRLEEIGYKE